MSCLRSTNFKNSSRVFSNEHRAISTRCASASTEDDRKELCGGEVSRKGRSAECFSACARSSVQIVRQTGRGEMFESLFPDFLPPSDGGGLWIRLIHPPVDLLSLSGNGRKEGKKNQWRSSGIGMGWCSVEFNQPKFGREHYMGGGSLGFSPEQVKLPSFFYISPSCAGLDAHRNGLMRVKGNPICVFPVAIFICNRRARFWDMC